MNESAAVPLVEQLCGFGAELGGAENALVGQVAEACAIGTSYGYGFSVDEEIPTREQ
jgi:hypothetical protein